jgi:hypothetical protein
MFQIHNSWARQQPTIVKGNKSAHHTEQTAHHTAHHTQTQHSRHFSTAVAHRALQILRRRNTHLRIAGK